MSANKNWISISSVCLAVLLSACANAPETAVVTTGLPHSDSFRVQRAQSSDYDYLVTVKNGKDLGINADNQQARDRMALLALKNQCEAPQIIKETAFSDTSMFGEGSGRTYELQIKC